jgi:large subunit ribosomal protein L25
MSDTMTIEVQPRNETGKNANRRSRAAGKIPAVVYGGGKESVAIEVDRKTLLDMMKGHSGENPIFLLKLGDKDRHAMIRNMDIDPLSRQVIHIDFQRVLG